TQGHVVNRKRVRRLMRLLGLVAIYPRPNTSKQAAAHKIYRYLLGGIAIERVNQVWCSDATYIPMAKGFLYLVVIMDWVSRAVLAWRLSNTLGAEFCVEALEEALVHYGRPEIFNTDKCSQFTSDDFTDTLKRHEVTISMDGKGCQDTEVEITFEAVGTDTRVTVIHRGWDSIPPEHAARHCFPDAIFLRRHGEWWQLLLGRLRAQCLPSPRDTPTARSLSGSRSYTSARRTHRVPSRQSRRPWCGVPRGLIHRTKPASSSLSLPYCGDAGVSNAQTALVFS